MLATNSNFENLEKQLAKDALEKALKGLHGEITKDIEKNKATFSKEIQKTLNAFKRDLEETLSKELDQRISAHLKNNFLDISTKVTTSFYDALSPPWFLYPENSMGAFKQDLTVDEKEYGEAIVEVRGIKEVQPWFLKKCGLKPEITGSFLTKSGKKLRKHALRLFDFLENFLDPETGMCVHNLEVYGLGMPYALKKY